MSSHLTQDLSTINEDNGDFISTNRPNDLRNIYRPAKHQVVLLPTTSSHDIQSENVQRFTGLGLEIASTVIGNLISHPCIVLRRQCQVNKKANSYHLTPLSLVPVIIRLHNRQGLKIFWKGAGGIFIVRGVAVGVETVIAEVTPFPREISFGSSLKNIAQHLVLKSLTYALLTPFYCSSLTETVQSEIASDRPGVFDCLSEGIRRLFRWGTPHSTRLFPVWRLLFPTMAHGLLDYVISSLVQCMFMWIITRKLQNECAKGAIRKNHYRTPTYLNSLSSAYFGHMVAEIILFPVETVLNRLYLQGTRTIIDNLDSGISVIPVITTYESAIDCFHTIVAEEGSMGLYKGFGALIIEYSLQMVLLKIAAIGFEQLASLVSLTKGTKGRL